MKKKSLFLSHATHSLWVCTKALLTIATPGSGLLDGGAITILDIAGCQVRGKRKLRVSVEKTHVLSE